MIECYDRSVRQNEEKNVPYFQGMKEDVLGQAAEHGSEFRRHAPRNAWKCNHEAPLLQVAENEHEQAIAGAVGISHSKGSEQQAAGQAPRPQERKLTEAAKGIGLSEAKNTRKGKTLPKTSTTRGGAYNPNFTVRAFLHVKRISGYITKLLCSRCGFRLTSDWYVKIASGKVCALIPKNGH